jgi:hypothetical protein
MPSRRLTDSTRINRCVTLRRQEGAERRMSVSLATGDLQASSGLLVAR